MKTPQTTFDHAVGQQLKDLRTAEGITQDQLADRMRKLYGIPWTRDTVAAVESKGRPLLFSEAVGLAQVLPQLRDRGPGGLVGHLPGNQWLAVSEIGQVTVRGIRAALAGNPLPSHEVTRTPWTDEVLLSRQRASEYAQELRAILRHSPAPDERRAFFAAIHGTAERKAARRLNTSPARIAASAISLWGQGLTQERETRLAARNAPTNPGAANTTRGHITRALLTELRDALTRQGAQP